MARILHLLGQRPGRSGSGVFLKALVREAARRGYEQQAIVTGPAETSAAEVPPLADGELTVAAFPCPEAPFPVPGASDVMPYASTVFSTMSDLQLEQYHGVLRRAMETVRERFRPHVVHTHHLWLMSALASEVFAGTPTVATSHNSELRQMIKVPHLAPRVAPGVRRLDRLCALTPQSRHDIREIYGVEGDRIAITGAGFRGSLFRPPEEPRSQGIERLRREHGIDLGDGGEPFVTFIARLSSAKGLPCLLAAVSRLEREGGPPFRLLLVGASGSGDDGRRMDELVAAAGERVLHLGAMPQAAVAEVLRCSDLFVLPSLFEGLPLVMLEAAACGCPCLVNGLPTIRSWVPEEWLAGGCFRLVEPLATTLADRPVEEDVPRYVAALAEGLRRALEEPPDAEARRRLVAGARAHTWEAVFARYEEVYASLGVELPPRGA